MLAQLLAPEAGYESDNENFDCSFLSNPASNDDEGEMLEVDSERIQSGSDEETEPESLPVLEILNRFCLKIREEAMISNKAVERIRSVTVSLLKMTAQQSKAQVSKILRDNGIDPSTMPELQDAFLPSSWEPGSSEFIDHGDYGNCFPNISPREITLGKRRQWKRLKNGRKSRIIEHPEKFYYISLIASLEILLNNQKILDMVAEPKASDPSSSLLCDFIDGTTVQTHELFSLDNNNNNLILIVRKLHVNMIKC